MNAGETHFVNIDSLDDPRLSDFRGLRNRPTGRAMDDSFFIVEGQLITSRLIASEFNVRSVIIEKGRDPNLLGSVDPSTPVFVMSRDQIEQLAGFHFHRGFLASASRKPLQPLNDFQPQRLSLALIQITDMENLGSMLRSAAAFGITQILIDDTSVDPYSRRAVRVSMGAALGMRFVALGDPATGLQTLADQGVEILAATLAPDSVSSDKVAVGANPIVIAVGNEAKGLPIDVQQAATTRVTIPMGSTTSAQMVDSLNVSVAAAILMHSLSSQQ